MTGEQVFRRIQAAARASVTPHLVGYGAIGQAKWAAWRRKEALDSVSEALLDDQARLVASYLDPVFVRGMEDDAPTTQGS